LETGPDKNRAKVFLLPAGRITPCGAREKSLLSKVSRERERERERESLGYIATVHNS
jgi:hypothetical protein